jgi:hypothetical protein
MNKQFIEDAQADFFMKRMARQGIVAGLIVTLVVVVIVNL